MSVLVFSDLHVESAIDPIYARLLQALRSTAAGDSVVLAGDIFDVFVGGNPVFAREYAEFMMVLWELESRGVVVHYIEGNHDFHLRGEYAEIPAVRVHASEVALDFDGRRIFVAHGDLADESDRGYLRLRAFFRGDGFRAFARLSPGVAMKWIGRILSSLSRRAHADAAKTMAPDALSRLRGIYRAYAERRLRDGFQCVVLGHCHDADEWIDPSSGGQYINMGYPKVHGTYLRLDAGESRFRRTAF
ncbi:MAG: UDP-2,3-diacylglucosamine diphosphatase [Bacteriovoracia bacterium]